MDVIDGFDLGMLLNGNRIEPAHFSHLHERGLERAERLHGRVRPHVLVSVEKGDPVYVLYLHDRTVEAAFTPRRRGALLTLDRIGVDVVAREAVFGRDQIGGNALRHEIVRDRNRRIDRPSAAGCADADAAHRFSAAADRHVLLSGHDLRGGEVHRVETGGAETIDLHARDTVAITGDERRRARDIGAGLADRINHAHHDVIDQSRIEIVAALDSAKRLAGEIERGHFVKRTIDFAAATGSAHVIVNEGVRHGVSSWRRCVAIGSWKPNPPYRPSFGELQ